MRGDKAQVRRGRVLAVIWGTSVSWARQWARGPELGSGATCEALARAEELCFPASPGLGGRPRAGGRGGPAVSPHASFPCQLPLGSPSGAQLPGKPGPGLPRPTEQRPWVLSVAASGLALSPVWLFSRF